MLKVILTIVNVIQIVRLFFTLFSKYIIYMSTELSQKYNIFQT